MGLGGVVILGGLLGRIFLAAPEREPSGTSPAGPPGVRSRVEARPSKSLPVDRAEPPSSPTPAVDETDAHGRLVLQAASYRTRRRAEEVLRAIRSETGLSGAVLPSTVNGERWHRILLGPFADETEAERAAALLRETRLTGEALVRPVPPGWDAAQAPEGW